MVSRLGLSCFLVVSFLAGCSKDNTVVSGSEICAAGQYNCRGDLLQVCNAARSGWDDLLACEPGACVQGESSCRAVEGGTGGTGGAGGTGGTASEGGAGTGGTVQTGGTGATGGSAGSGGDPLDAGVDAPPVNYPTQSHFCNARAEAECSAAMLSACGVTRTQCEEYRAQKCDSEAPKDRDYREVASGACVALVASVYEDAKVTHDDLVSIRKTCEFVFGTDAEAGVGCAKNWDCNLDEGMLCVNTVSCKTASCELPTYLDAGEVCAQPGTVCPQEHFCSAYAGVTCVPWAKKGEFCVDCPQPAQYPVPCEPQLRCQPVDGGYACQDKLVNGAPCSTDSDCAGGICLLLAGNQRKCGSAIVYDPTDPGCGSFGKP
jgi:hypothetical protein